MGFELAADYKDVATRIADFRAKHPEGCLRPANPEVPYTIEAVNGSYFIVYAAAAYRAPNDPLPGIGVAWEPFPGKTPYTANSELQNAETSAWGRAIVAALASESKAIASAEDVRNRQADGDAAIAQVEELRAAVTASADALDDDDYERLRVWSIDRKLPKQDRLTAVQAQDALAFIATLGTKTAMEGTGVAVAEPAPTGSGGGVEPSPNGPAPTPYLEPGALTEFDRAAKDMAAKAERTAS